VQKGGDQAIHLSSTLLVLPALSVQLSHVYRIDVRSS
jgi:hypothetical protein